MNFTVARRRSSPAKARSMPGWMLVGEQPGDHEDLAGKPFVGPAGGVLARALEAAEIPRAEVFVTNAVKQPEFRFEQRGKRRLHKRPGASEIEACRWWLDRERELIRQAVIVALGVTAARGVFGRVVTIGKMRDQTEALADGTLARVTIHPSALLRLRTEEEKRAGYRSFVDDLRVAGALAGFGR